VNAPSGEGPVGVRFAAIAIQTREMGKEFAEAEAQSTRASTALGSCGVLLGQRYDWKTFGTCGSSTRRSSVGRRTPSGGGEAVPPSEMK
jgi:hypothetical protein